MNKQVKIRDVITLWKEEKKQYVKHSTYMTYHVLINRHIIPYFGDKYEVLNSDVQKFVLLKIEEKLTNKSIKDIIMILKMILRYGVKMKILAYQEIDVIFPIERRKKDLEVLSINNQKKIMKYIKENLTFRNLGIYICLSTGLRIGEICALKWEDINIDAGILKVNKTIQRVYKIDSCETELLVDTPKTINSQREIPILGELLKILKPFVKIMNQDYYILSNDIVPIEPRTYRNYYKQLLKHLNIAFIKFHGLRHSFATRCIESNCDYKTVSVILGHSSISTTMNLYVHPNMEQKKKCLMKMTRLLR